MGTVQPPGNTERREERIPLTGTAQEVFESLLLDKLTASAEWRIRKVERITPIDSYTYGVKASYHCRISSQLIRETLNRVRADLGELGDNVQRTWRSSGLEDVCKRLNAEDGADAEVRTLLPLALLRKQVLLSFSIFGPDGAPTQLIPRFEASWITETRIFRQLVEEHFERLKYLAFHEKNENMIATIAYRGPGQAEWKTSWGFLLRKVFGEGRAANEFARFLSSRLIPYFGAKDELDAALATEENSFQIEEAFRRGRTLFSALAPDLAEELVGGLDEPIRNPLLLAPAYFEISELTGLSAQHAPVEILGAFLVDCSSFLEDLVQAGNQSQADLAKVLRVLTYYADYYAAYVPARIRPDEDFVIKLQLLKQFQREGSRLREVGRWIPAWQEQSYPVVLGDFRSCHFEISCGEPTELLQIPECTTVGVERIRLRPERIFDGRHTTRHLQHLYTSMRPQVLNRLYKSVSGKNLEQMGYLRRGVDVQLNVILAIPRSLWLITYLPVVFLVVSLVAFLITFDPFVSTAPSTKVLESLPWLFPGVSGLVTIVTLMLRIRVEEPIVRTWLQQRVVLVLMLVAIMAIYATLGFAQPSVTNGVRIWLSRHVACPIVAHKSIFRAQMMCP